jgi:hypothetical protein
MALRLCSGRLGLRGQSEMLRGRCKVRLPRLLVTICNQATRPVFRGYNSLIKAMRRHFQASITSGLSHHVSISPDGPVRNIKENTFREL